MVWKSTDIPLASDYFLIYARGGVIDDPKR
ncbi:hypothetical protein ABID56_000908 [Alkalibacillus flavidus]|uniref:Uncharacterized protein n=1 Tax=Alkalibacillus flavidus TaxID=546021 RepID=A0ABV2KTB1_9BACI